MSQRVEKEFQFFCAMHFKGNFHLNTYDMTLSMLLEAEANEEQHTALDRISYFIFNCINNKLFINGEEKEALEKYINAGLDPIVLNAEPYDQIVAMTLLQKMNAITEGRIIITDTLLNSMCGDGVRFHIVSEMCDEYFAKDHSKWWNCSSTNTQDSKEIEDEEKIVKLFQKCEWDKIDLGYPKSSSGKNN